MGKLRLGPILDDRPITRTVKLSAALDSDLRAYSDAYADAFGPTTVERLIPAMLDRFMRTDREFMKTRRTKSIGPAHSAAND
jgi:hypothetical protein